MPQAPVRVMHGEGRVIIQFAAELGFPLFAMTPDEAIGFGKALMQHGGEVIAEAVNANG
jgi:hypothetical protein